MKKTLLVALVALTLVAGGFALSQSKTSDTAASATDIIAFGIKPGG